MTGTKTIDRLDDPGLEDTDDGVLDYWGSGHVSGPWDPDEVALLAGQHGVLTKAVTWLWQRIRKAVAPAPAVCPDCPGTGGANHVHHALKTELGQHGAPRDDVAAIATRQAEIEKDLLYLDEDDLPALAGRDDTEAVTMKARLMVVRTSLLNELVNVTRRLEKARRRPEESVTPLVSAAPKHGDRGGVSHAGDRTGPHVNGITPEERLGPPLLLFKARRKHPQARDIRTGQWISDVVKYPAAMRAIEQASPLAVKVRAAWRALDNDDLHAAAIAELRVLAKTEQKIHNPDLRGVIQFSRQSRKKSTQADFKERRELLLLGDLPRLLSVARLIESGPPTQPDLEPNTRAYHYVSVKVRVGPREPWFYAVFNVREDHQGRFFYNARARDTLKAVVAPRALTGFVPTPASGGDDKTPRVHGATTAAILARDTPLLKTRKLHYRRDVDGLAVSIENRCGSHRHWTDHDGTDGVTKLQHPYGYARGTRSPTDGDHLDVFLGPLARSGQVEGTTVYVITTNKPPTFTELDEQKAMIGFPSAEAARAAVLANYGNEARFIRQIDALPWAQFKADALRTGQLPELVGGDVVARDRGLLLFAKASAPPSKPLLRTMPKPGGPARHVTIDEARAAGRRAIARGAATPAPKDVPPPPQVAPKAMAGHVAGFGDLLERALAQLATTFPGVPMAGRAKQTATLTAKIATADPTQDLAGSDDTASIRLLLDDLDDEQLAAQRLQRLLGATNVRDYVTRPLGLGGRGVDVTVTIEGRPIEVQLRTARQVAWSDYAHDVAVKTRGTVPPEVGQYLRAMSEAFAAADRGEAPGELPECPEVLQSMLGPLMAPTGVAA